MIDLLLALAKNIIELQLQYSQFPLRFGQLLFDFLLQDNYRNRTPKITCSPFLYSPCTDCRTPPPRSLESAVHQGQRRIAISESATLLCAAHEQRSRRGVVHFGRKCAHARSSHVNPTVLGAICSFAHAAPPFERCSFVSCPK